MVELVQLGSSNGTRRNKNAGKKMASEEHDCCRVASRQPDKEAPKWRVRQMQHKDISRCLQIWAEVELTEARQTVASALTFDPDGFFVAEIDGTGEFGRL